MSQKSEKSSKSSNKGSRSNKIRALEEVVSLLKRHVKQREAEIERLGFQLKDQTDRIQVLERRLEEKEVLKRF